MKKITLLGLTMLMSIAIQAQTTLSYNTDDTVTGTNSVGCPGGDNDWARNFILADFGIDTSLDFTISGGAFGVQTNDATGTTVTVTIFGSDGDFPASFDDTNVLGTQDVTVDETAAETAISFDFDTPVVVPSGTDAIVFALTTPLGNNFFIGGTADETADGYLRSVDCAVTDYITATSINFPNAHFYMTLTGEEVLGIDESPFVNSLSIYPNPAVDILNIDFPRGLEGGSIEIVNITGQRVMQQTLQNVSTQSIDVSNLNKGVYFARLNSSEGNGTLRFVKR